MSTMLYSLDKSLLALSESIKNKRLDPLEFEEKSRILLEKILIIYYENNDQILAKQIYYEKLFFLSKSLLRPIQCWLDKFSAAN
jgi:hypothetical protein